MQVQVKIEQIIQEIGDAFTLELENHPEIANYKPGQFLNFFLDINGEEVVRQYSFSTSPYLNEKPGITIKRVPGGLASNYLGDQLKPGDSIEVSTPNGRFTTSTNNGRQILMVAGGSGITPLYSILKTILASESDSIISLFYANRNADSIIFRNQLDSFERQYESRLKVTHFLSENNNETLDNAIYRRLNPKDFQKYIDTYWKQNPEAFICGPDSIMKMSQDSLINLGVPDERIKTEAFVGSGFGENAAGHEEAFTEVIIENFNGAPVTFSANRNQSVLKSAFDAGFRLKHSCQESMCGACKVRLLSGKLNMKTNYALPDDELDQGYVLLCSGFPESDKLELQYE
ncbi:ferredoxin--NADP reductase [Ekhidna sp.]|uniref:ferredoxin--NADP reductase n=1 Tax=Ekhidna sp. TaxID=2608089 RepID=UPI0032EB1130